MCLSLSLLDPLHKATKSPNDARAIQAIILRDMFPSYCAGKPAAGDPAPKKAGEKDSKKKRWKERKVPWRLKAANEYVAYMVKKFKRVRQYFVMNHHCPAKHGDLTSSSHSQVSAFVKALLNRLIHPAFWGSADNKKVVFRGVDMFVRLRRFEEVTLHHVMHGFQTTRCQWTHPSGTGGEKVSVVEHSIRTRLVGDFVFWIFSYLVVPVLKGNFYVTESIPFKRRTLYYRHDIWNKIFRQSFATVSPLFTKETDEGVSKILSRRKYGFSPVRFLPKHTGARPIVNLKRHQPVAEFEKYLTKDYIKKTYKSASVKAYSANIQLRNPYRALKYEQVSMVFAFILLVLICYSAILGNEGRVVGELSSRDKRSL